MATHAGDGDNGPVDFGVFDDDDDDDDDVPALLDDDIIGIDDDDESIDSMPGAPRGARIVDLDDEEEDRIDSIDNLPAEDEDGLLGVDDHIVDGDLEDIDEHAAKWEACKARKAADIGKTIKVEHKKSETMWEWTIVEDHIPVKSTIKFEQVGLRGFNFEDLLDCPALDVFFKLWPGDHKERLRSSNR